MKLGMRAWLGILRGYCTKRRKAGAQTVSKGGLSTPLTSNADHADHDRLRVQIALAARAGHSNDTQGSRPVRAIGADHDFGRVAGRARLIDDDPQIEISDWSGARALRPGGPAGP